MYSSVQQPRTNLIHCLSFQTAEEMAKTHFDAFEYLQDIAHVIFHDRLKSIFSIDDSLVVIMPQHDYSFALEAIARIKLRHYVNYSSYSRDVQEIFKTETTLFTQQLNNLLYAQDLKVR